MENNYAQISFQNVCQFFDKRGWNYDADQQSLSIRYTVGGEDLDMSYKIFFEEERSLFIIISNLPFTVPSEKVVEYSIASNLVNDNIPFGSFSYNMSKGSSSFTLVNTFRTNPINEKMMDFFMSYVDYMVDKFNDKLYEVSRGYLNPVDIIKEQEG